MSRARRLSVIAISLVLTAGLSVAAAPMSSATTGSPSLAHTNGPIRCC
jgi:hypothetical protein